MLGRGGVEALVRLGVGRWDSEAPGCWGVGASGRRGGAVLVRWGAEELRGCGVGAPLRRHISGYGRRVLRLGRRLLRRGLRELRLSRRDLRLGISLVAIGPPLITIGNSAKCDWELHELRSGRHSSFGRH